jgi:hypothetical protein
MARTPCHSGCTDSSGPKLAEVKAELSFREQLAELNQPDLVAMQDWLDEQEMQDWMDYEEREALQLRLDQWEQEEPFPWEDDFDLDY